MFSKRKNRFFKRIDTKLTAWYILTFLGIMIIVSGLLYYRLSHNLMKEVDRMLEDEAIELITHLSEISDQTNRQLKEFEKTVSFRKYYRMAFRLIDQEGKTIYTSSKLRDFTFPEVSIDRGRYQKVINESVKLLHHSSPFRLCTYYHREGSEVKYVVQIATYLRMMRKTIDNFRNNLITALLLAFILGSVGGWLLARKSLRPIDKITATTKRITATSLSERLPLKGTDDELDQLAKTINQMIERIERSFQKLSQFTADAAHELRTPLTALKGETEVLLSKMRSSEEYQDALSNNLERLDYLTRLLNDLLFLSKADEGEKSFQIETVDLIALLKQLGDAFAMIAAQKNINFNFNGDEKAIIQGDSVKLKQLFSNLIDNATKFTLPNGKISLMIHAENENVTVTLKDTGIGIPPDSLPSIFDRFYRVDKSRSRKSGGTGLGLSICQRIVNAHQGTIDVTSTLHQGTTVTVILPTTLT